MSFQKSKFHHPRLPLNELGLSYRDYEGSLSTLCAGCGHDAISAAVIQACHELSIPPHRVAKMSGIGCSSKAPNYFMNRAHGFNTVHGRMPSVTTGANMANRELIYIGMSGDGDTASIGLGQFAHVVRRRLNMLYMVANNGVYGLTKGQTAATADLGSHSKSGEANLFADIDLCVMALQLGASMVGRSFSGDKKQLVPLIKAALSHRGFAFLDIISPCVTFNNHATSTRSYDYVHEHIKAAGVVDFVPARTEIVSKFDNQKLEDICLHDGSILRIRRTDDDYDTHDSRKAVAAIEEHKAKGEILTGLLYIDPTPQEYHEMAGTSATPLSRLSQEDLCPGSRVLANINASFR
ncbi:MULTISPECIES: 2-oxoacid:ferredoxin oxidoreductase subunit beta [Shewanella]|uniref:2-oxoacid:ferredoxin oxidoreductase subunit beta n=1 Tax=Shewanella sedimentimangrovi TaxID=2814293 RepID=A0ABX7R1J1_9GAMM|nr:MULTISPECIES: 2-oxoacid:ferredoxin oxidoreductase subunit beta [Shewanella]QSX36725.1 2-oxoacid:ferredoxin oxidoreductase subunit beta [Shewanella sedimentimangrovi]QSX40331.1 2-oxoacid:ferredoxin oxidoreductase subunit beta [Shewanella cyperi]